MSQTGSGRKTTPFPVVSLAVTAIFRRKPVFWRFSAVFGPSRPHATDHAQRPPVAHTVGVHMSRQVHLSHGVRLGSSGASYMGPYGPLVGCIVEGICDHIRRISRHIATLWLCKGQWLCYPIWLYVATSCPKLPKCVPVGAPPRHCRPSRSGGDRHRHRLAVPTADPCRVVGHQRSLDVHSTCLGLESRVPGLPLRVPWGAGRRSAAVGGHARAGRGAAAPAGNR